MTISGYHMTILMFQKAMNNNVSTVALSSSDHFLALLSSKNARWSFIGLLGGGAVELIWALLLDIKFVLRWRYCDCVLFKRFEISDHEISSDFEYSLKWVFACEFVCLLIFLF